MGSSNAESTYPSFHNSIIVENNRCSYLTSYLFDYFVKDECEKRSAEYEEMIG